MIAEFAILIPLHTKNMYTDGKGFHLRYLAEHYVRYIKLNQSHIE